MILITDPSPATDTATDILFRSTTDPLASHCRSPVVSGSHLNWKRLRCSERMATLPCIGARRRARAAWFCPEDSRRTTANDYRTLRGKANLVLGDMFAMHANIASEVCNPQPADLRIQAGPIRITVATD